MKITQTLNVELVVANNIGVFQPTLLATLTGIIQNEIPNRKIVCVHHEGESNMNTNNVAYIGWYGPNLVDL